MPSPRLNKTEFKARYRAQFYDPAFAAAPEAVDGIAEIAWQAYRDERKSPVTRKAGKGYHDPVVSQFEIPRVGEKAYPLFAP